MNISLRALRRGSLQLHLINAENFPEVARLFTGYPDSDYMLSELHQSYIPRYDMAGRRIIFGFYATLDGELAGGSLLGISDWDNLHGYTGADTFEHMRGRGVAPGSKPHLFYLGFHLLGLNRIETGCLVSNTASQRSIEKTAGFVYEGTLRQFQRNAAGTFEDERRYAILRHDWERLYDPAEIEVLDGG